MPWSGAGGEAASSLQPLLALQWLPAELGERKGELDNSGRHLYMLQCVCGCSCSCWVFVWLSAVT